MRRRSRKNTLLIQVVRIWALKSIIIFAKGFCRFVFFTSGSYNSNILFMNWTSSYSASLHKCACIFIKKLHRLSKTNIPHRIFLRHKMHAREQTIFFMKMFYKIGFGKLLSNWTRTSLGKRYKKKKKRISQMQIYCMHAMLFFWFLFACVYITYVGTYNKSYSLFY